jgi:nucleoside-diphosphate-sugar epimerase
MKIIVLGAAGFLGSRLVKNFSEKDNDVVTLSYRPEVRSAFVADFELLLKKFVPHVVINAGAAQNGSDDPVSLEELISSNIFLPATVASLMIKYCPEACLINFGTSWQIGEAGESSPFNAYAASKSGVEPFFDHFALSGLRVATLRLYDTYGPNDPRNKVINLISDSLIKKSELPMSAGKQLIDLIHVDDAVAAVEVTLEFLSKEKQGIHKTYAVRSGQPVTILDALAILKKVAGIETAPFIKPGIFPYRMRERFFLYADTPMPPGWYPRIELAKGLAELFNARCEAAQGDS